MQIIFIFMLTQLYYHCWRVKASSAEWAARGTDCFQNTAGTLRPAAPAILLASIMYKLREGCEDCRFEWHQQQNLEGTSGAPAGSFSKWERSGSGSDSCFEDEKTVKTKLASQCYFNRLSILIDIVVCISNTRRNMSKWIVCGAL